MEMETAGVGIKGELRGNRSLNLTCCVSKTGRAPGLAGFSSTYYSSSLMIGWTLHRCKDYIRHVISVIEQILVGYV